MTREQLLYLSQAVLGLGSVGFAVYAQFNLGTPPCAWCILIRVILLVWSVQALLLLAGSFKKNNGTQIAWALKLSAIGFWISTTAIGLGVSWYLKTVAVNSTSCALTFADKFINASPLPQWVPALFEIQATCADMAKSLSIVPFDTLSVAFFGLELGILVGLFFWVFKKGWRQV